VDRIGGSQRHEDCGQPWWSAADLKMMLGVFYMVEQKGFEPLTSWLQISARPVCRGRWSRSAICRGPAWLLAADGVAVS
jgi:hypothetical protein